MPASHQSNMAVSAEPSEVFEACLKAVDQCGFRVAASNPETGQIEARTKMGIRSWGEIITIAVGAEGTVGIKSSCRGMQMVDYGKNKANVNALSSALATLVPRPPQR
jgi:hypothetical protein